MLNLNVRPGASPFFLVDDSAVTNKYKSCSVYRSYISLLGHYIEWGGGGRVMLNVHRILYCLLGVHCIDAQTGRREFQP